ncbi:carboxypeptidase-like regulatory domain-containing protein [Sansalvadorimonas verongulae]|uniref:carboxypeptidase-like regulatory domain-containing protein n=1 Tax=Sansalvadorimonas verongulae TaxID=2172824 RepID=UPI0012BB7689|nr:carboxypeptidase-like regulatory domain-containing protein [Sansalvadorimonas verongulae]MTI12601.1 hypothetical protein [Sansalvadorimonas verongulae]
MMKRCIAILALVLSASPAWAHKFKIFATAEGPVIQGEAYFVGAGKARGAAVDLLKDGQVIASTKANDNGSFTFQSLTPAQYTIHANASQGHVAEYTITAEEMGGTSTSPPAEDTSKPTPRGSGHLASVVDQAVDRAVARQLVPLRKQIEQLQEKRYYQDILGAIGYIFGLAGFAAFYLSRKKNK